MLNKVWPRERERERTTSVALAVVSHATASSAGLQFWPPNVRSKLQSQQSDADRRMERPREGGITWFLPLQEISESQPAAASFPPSLSPFHSFSVSIIRESVANGECRVEDSFTVKELRIIEWKWYRVMTSSFSPHDSPNLLTGRPHGRRTTAARPAGGRNTEEWTIEQVGADDHPRR